MTIDSTKGKSGEIPVADPGFLRGGANLRGGAPTYYLETIFAENCMKMKEFWPGEHP